MPRIGCRSPDVPGSQNGFTMIEMMVVLVIVAMAMTVAPAIISGMSGSKLRAASDDLVAQLREGRNQALRRGSTVELAFDLKRRGYTISTSPGFHALPVVVDAIDVKAASPAEPDGNPRISFLSDGTATQAKISLHHGNSSRVIAVDWLTGRVRHDS